MLIANARNMADTRDATTACMKLWVSSFSAFWEKSYWKVREMGNCGCPDVFGSNGESWMSGVFLN